MQHHEHTHCVIPAKAGIQGPRIRATGKFHALLLAITALFLGWANPAAADSIADYEASINDTCQTDADCAVKDIHNCCGYYPACTNRDAKTDRNRVRAICAGQGLSGICGFPAISGCRCVENKCTDFYDPARGAAPPPKEE